MIRPLKVSTSCLLVLRLVALSLVLSAAALSTLGAVPAAKVVQQYALTSANDFPQRDPQDWRLLASSDEGKTWTTLDIRQGELFPQRQQRRVFKVAHPGAYQLYRLQIDRVRTPTEADSVQLAEVEPLGDSEDDLEPAPLLEDQITAQGESPPLEDRFQAFDGRPETKWLDHATQFPGSRASWIQWQYTSPAHLLITNIQRLAALHNRARRAYPVRLEGVVVGHCTRDHTLCLLDSTGAMELPETRDTRSFLPGQRLLVEGTSEWRQQRVGIAQARFHCRGPAPASEPKWMAPAQPLRPEEELQWSEVEGRIRFCSRSEQGWVLEVENNQQSLSVRVLRLEGTNRPPPSGTQVRVRGLCEGVLDARGERVAGTLWVPRLEEVAVVSTTHEPASTPGAPPSQGPPGGTAPELTRIEQLRQLSPEELVRWPKVKVQGVVTEIFGGFLQAGNAGVEVWYGAQGGAKAPSFGAYVEVEGRGDWANGHGPIIRADQVRVLGHGKPPPPERCSWSQLASGRLIDQWVEVEGVVRSTDGSHLLLNSEGGRLMATIRSGSAPRVRALVDALVRVRGVNVAATDSRGRLQGIQILVPSLEFVEVEQAAADPFSLPAQPIGSLLQVREQKEFAHRVKVEGVLTFREGRNFFLQDASGGAMAIAQEEVMLNTPAGGWSWVFWQNASNQTAELQWQVGDELEVVGFPEMRGYAPVLTEVLARKGSGTNSAQPIQATVSELAGGALDATLVSLEAEVLRQELLGPHLVLELLSGQRVFQAYLRATAAPLPAIAPGSRVRVTGVCQVEPLPYAGLGKGVASFKLLVGSPAALKVLARPSWWTLKRALVLTGTLLVVLALAAGWIGILRRQVEERTKQLQQAIAEHEKTEARLALETQRVHAEIEERKRIEAEVERGHRQLLQASRLAGMAEVATSVLHNVGNVLNSANVLASLLVEQVQRSKVSSLARLAALLGEHRADLGGFVTADARGKELPGYVERLAAHLQQEQAKLLEKTKLLTESLQHIKEIVAMQQNYAKVSGLLETVSLAEIVEDALRMHEGALARHQIQVRRDFQPVPPVTIDRHKLLQILFNLLENAKHACAESGRADKAVTVRLRPQGPEHTHIEVCDNGVGIAAENLSRIFGQEFSTRKGGHGFGLHSSILAAQDMGASLSARSDGPGHGALFILELPTSPPGQPTGNGRPGSPPPKSEKKA